MPTAATLAVVEVAWIIPGLTVGGYLLTLLLVPIVLLQRKRYPTATLAWIMAIAFLPYAGGLMYLVFGINSVRRRVELKQRSDTQINRSLPGLTQYELSHLVETDPFLQPLKRLATRVSGTRSSFGNQVEILSDTNRTLGLMRQAIEGARSTIHLEYYIWKPDKTGQSLRKLLLEQAARGVRIRFLYDGLGSGKLGPRFLRPMQEAGISVARFLPGSSLRERWSVNLRNHRKLTLVDGQIAFTGGMNIGDEYVGKDKSHGFWRDTHMRIEGPAVLQLQQMFAEDWYFATGEELTARGLFPHPVVAGDTEAQVITSGPDSDVDTFHSLFFAAINAAQYRITLASSYFVPTPALMMALETAAQRGVQVRLLMSARGAYRPMILAAQSYYEPLLECGCEIYDYQRGLMHSKTLTVDGRWSVVGSANFDTRSLQINFEAGLVLYGARHAQQLEEQFAEDLKYSRRIVLAEWRKRGIWQQLQEQAVALFSPVL